MQGDVEGFLVVNEEDIVSPSSLQPRLHHEHGWRRYRSTEGPSAASSLAAGAS